MTKRYFCVVVAVLITFMLLPGCAAQGVQPVLKPVDNVDAAVSGPLADFSIDLFKRTVAQESGGNVFISPLSVWLALGMLYNGASGGTADGMAQTLHASGVSMDTLNNANAGLMGLLEQADPKVHVDIANSVWMRKGFDRDVGKQFVNTSKKYYGASVQPLDFSAAGAADTINNWVSQNTNGNIKNLVEPPIDPSTLMLLVNAVHFKAPWKAAFAPEATQDDVFTTSDGMKVQAKYLFNREGNFGFCNGDVMAACIPYASGRLEMVAVMPEKQDLADFIRSLDTSSLYEYIGKCSDTTMSLEFPKFRVEYGTGLKDALTGMGMGEAFTANADFSALTPKLRKQLSISEVKHKTFIEVDEQGTEADAATLIEAPGCPAPQPVNLVFNKPFIYVISDTVTGTILFIGAMENPAV